VAGRSSVRVFDDTTTGLFFVYFFILFCFLLLFFYFSLRLPAEAGALVTVSCYYPISAFKTEAGSIVFHEVRNSSEVVFACGQCIGCRLRRSRNWAIRCMHEHQMNHGIGSFVTLTYKYDTCPTLVYDDFQKFMKRLRKALGPTRFFAVGEYGDDEARKYEGLGRPHFHALLFGRFFADRKRYDDELYTSATLEKLWPHGHCPFGEITFQSAGYVARYCCTKVTGNRAADHYRRVDIDTGHLVDVVPEFAHMSLGGRNRDGGIGASWFRRYWPEVYLARDGVMIKDKMFPPPRYYDDLLNLTCPDFKEEKDYDRYVRSLDFAADCTPERLLSREIVEKARFSQLKRKFS